MTTNQVSAMFGVSLRQLQCWDERKLVKPIHHQHRRIYDSGDVIEIGLIAELRRQGMSLQAIRTIVKVFANQHGEPKFLVTDGKRIRHWLFTEQQALQAALNVRGPVYIVALAEIRARAGMHG